MSKSCIFLFVFVATIQIGSFEAKPLDHLTVNLNMDNSPKGITEQSKVEGESGRFPWAIYPGVECRNGSGATDGKVLDNVDWETCLYSCQAVAGCEGVVRRKNDAYGKGRCWHEHNIDLKLCGKNSDTYDLYKNKRKSGGEEDDTDPNAEGESDIFPWASYPGVECRNGIGATDGKVLDNVDWETCTNSCQAVAKCEGVVRRKNDDDGKGRCWHEHNIDLNLCVKNSDTYDLWKNKRESGDMIPSLCYAKSTDNTQTIQCANGNFAEIWDGCIRQGSYIVRCPKNHFPCNSLSSNGKEFSCQKDCSGHGGPKSCLLDDYVGCYDNTKQPKMYNRNTIDLKGENSQAECQLACLKQHQGSNYLGLENGSICRCDMYAPPTSSVDHPKVEDYRCEENQCPGASKTMCGGTGYVKVFHIYNIDN